MVNIAVVAVVVAITVHVTANVISAQICSSPTPAHPDTQDCKLAFTYISNQFLIYPYSSVIIIEF
jgi:hypothetical protein